MLHDDTERMNWLDALFLRTPRMYPHIVYGSTLFIIWDQGPMKILGEGTTLRAAIDNAIDKETPK